MRVFLLTLLGGLAAVTSQGYNYQIEFNSLLNSVPTPNPIIQQQQLQQQQLQPPQQPLYQQQPPQLQHPVTQNVFASGLQPQIQPQLTQTIISNPQGGYQFAHQLQQAEQQVLQYEQQLQQAQQSLILQAPQPLPIQSQQPVLQYGQQPQQQQYLMTFGQQQLQSFENQNQNLQYQNPPQLPQQQLLQPFISFEQQSVQPQQQQQFSVIPQQAPEPAARTIIESPQPQYQTEIVTELQLQTPEVKSEEKLELNTIGNSIQTIPNQVQIEQQQHSQYIAQEPLSQLQKPNQIVEQYDNHLVQQTHEQILENEKLLLQTNPLRTEGQQPKHTKTIDQSQQLQSLRVYAEHQEHYEQQEPQPPQTPNIVEPQPSKTEPLQQIQPPQIETQQQDLEPQQIQTQQLEAPKDFEQPLKLQSIRIFAQQQRQQPKLQHFVVQQPQHTLQQSHTIAQLQQPQHTQPISQQPQPIAEQPQPFVQQPQPLRIESQIQNSQLQQTKLSKVEELQTLKTFAQQQILKQPLQQSQAFIKPNEPPRFKVQQQVLSNVNQLLPTQPQQPTSSNSIEHPEFPRIYAQQQNQLPQKQPNSEQLHTQQQTHPVVVQSQPIKTELRQQVLQNENQRQPQQSVPARPVQHQLQFIRNRHQQQQRLFEKQLQQFQLQTTQPAAEQRQPIRIENQQQVVPNEQQLQNSLQSQTQQPTQPAVDQSIQVENKQQVLQYENPRQQQSPVPVKAVQQQLQFIRNRHQQQKQYEGQQQQSQLQQIQTPAVQPQPLKTEPQQQVLQQPQPHTVVNQTPLLPSPEIKTIVEPAQTQDITPESFQSQNIQSTNEPKTAEVQIQPNPEQNVTVQKEFYYLSAPPEEEPKDLTQQISSLKKNLRVVFIKAPENNGLEKAALQLAQQSANAQTAIYVLSKQHDATELAQKLQSVKEASRPEVSFIKYRTQAEAEHAQRVIQAKYEALDGPNHINRPQTAHAHNFVGTTSSSRHVATRKPATDNAKVDNSKPVSKYLPASVKK